MYWRVERDLRNRKFDNVGIISSSLIDQAWNRYGWIEQELRQLPIVTLPLAGKHSALVFLAEVMALARPMLNACVRIFFRLKYWWMNWGIYRVRNWSKSVSNQRMIKVQFYLELLSSAVHWFKLIVPPRKSFDTCSIFECDITTIMSRLVDSVLNPTRFPPENIWRNSES